MIPIISELSVRNLGTGPGERCEALRWSTERSLAADTLWVCGKRIEALQLARTALLHGLDALQMNGTLGAGLEAAEISGREARRIETAADALQLRLPQLEGDLEDAHARLFPLWQRACRSIGSALADDVEAPARRTRLRRITMAAAALGVLGLGILIAWNWIFWPEAVEVWATGYRVVDVIETWPPENAYDRDEMTYWHLPPGDTGSIELRLPEPRDISALRILNAHDRHVDDNNRRDRRRYDHASRQIVVRAYAGQRRLAETEAELPRVRNYERVTVPLEAAGVDRIEIEIVTFYGAGGGLAEIEILP